MTSPPQSPRSLALNLILFEPSEVTRPLPADDPRAVHLLKVLRRTPGDTFDAGLVDGPRGTATLLAIDPSEEGAPAALTLAFEWSDDPPPPLDPIRLIVGLPRPQTARRILQDATALGVAAIDFVHTGKGDPNYRRSKLWATGEWRRHLIAGAQQAFATRLPAVTFGDPLEATLATLPPDATRLALDNYEAASPLSEAAASPPVVIAIGPERGWAPRDRACLRDAGFAFTHLGARVLRVETAAVAAITLVRRQLGLL